MHEAGGNEYSRDITTKCKICITAIVAVVIVCASVSICLAVMLNETNDERGTSKDEQEKTTDQPSYSATLESQAIAEIGK